MLCFISFIRRFIMKLLQLLCLTTIVATPGLYAMDDQKLGEQKDQQTVENAGLFAMLPTELLSRIADIAKTCCCPKCDCGCCGDPVLDWKDINNTQSTCKFLRKYFINTDRDIEADFSQKRLDSESVQAFLDRVLVYMLKFNLNPHKNPVTLILSNNSLSADEPALAKFFKNIDTFGLSARIIDLQLSNNGLTVLPDNINSFKNLESLDLTDNLLSSNEVEKICVLKNLESLNIASNGLPAIPETIGSLEKIEELILRGNNLTALPDSIGS